MDAPISTTPRPHIVRMASDWSRRWRGPAIAAVALAAAGLWFGWPWLVTAGIAPIVLALAPCAVMCALGLCMSRAGRPSVAASDRPGGGKPLSEATRNAVPALGRSGELNAGRAYRDDVTERQVPSARDTPRIDGAPSTGSTQ
jgi:hypothetical protein